MYLNQRERVRLCALLALPPLSLSLPPLPCPSLFPSSFRRRSPLTVCSARQLPLLLLPPPPLSIHTHTHTHPHVHTGRGLRRESLLFLALYHQRSFHLSLPLPFPPSLSLSLSESFSFSSPSSVYCSLCIHHTKGKRICQSQRCEEAYRSPPHRTSLEKKQREERRGKRVSLRELVYNALSATSSSPPSPSRFSFRERARRELQLRGHRENKRGRERKGFSPSTSLSLSLVACLGSSIPQ